MGMWKIYNKLLCMEYRIYHTKVGIQCFVKLTSANKTLHFIVYHFVNFTSTYVHTSYSYMKYIMNHIFSKCINRYPCFSQLVPSYHFVNSKRGSKERGNN